MKKEVRLLKRERQRIAYENKIVELAEKKLLGKTPVVATQRTEILSETLRHYAIDEHLAPSWAKSPSGYGRTYFNLETTGLRGVSVTHFVHDEILVTFDPSVWERRAKAEEILHTYVLPRLPKTRVRSGQLGAVTLRIPGSKKCFVAVPDPAKRISIDSYIEQQLNAVLIAER